MNGDSNVRALRDRLNRNPDTNLPRGPAPPDNGDMEHRVTALETRLDTILPTLATKADIGELRAEFKGWTLTTALTIVGTMLAGFIGIASLIAKQGPAPAAQQPIIINVPAQLAPPAPATQAPRK